jgi:hypothetical protein
MAKVKKGIGLGFSGTILGLTFSQLADGSTTVRGAAKPRSKPLTVAQLSNNMDTSICSKFLGHVPYYVKVGYELETKPGINANNIIANLVRKAITGVYPHRKIDYSKVPLTRGKMPPPENAGVTVTDIGFKFTWNSSVDKPGTHYSDQVMLMAYFPQVERAVFVTGGAQRHTGSDLVVPHGIPRGNTAEIFISFIANDRKSISDSVYLGQLEW